MEDFVAGTLAGIGGLVVGYPADTVKVRLQSQHVKPGVTPKYKGTFHCFTTVVKEETVFGLFKGMLSPMAGVAVINAIIFGVYGSLLRYQMTEPEEDPTLPQIFWAGCGSGLVNCLVATPTEYAKIQLQNQSQHKSEQGPKYRGPTQFYLETFRKRGIRGLYKGGLSTILRETPSYGIYFAAYEVLCNSMIREDQTKDDLTWPSLLLAGGLSGIAGWLFIYPIDVVKTRIQDVTEKSKYQYKGIVDCVVTSYKEEGGMVFFRGLNATIVRAFPTNAVTLLVYTLTMRFLTNGSTPTSTK